MKVVEHNNLIYFEAEQLINAMIDNMSTAALELDVYGDEMTEDERNNISQNIKGYAAATKTIVDSYIDLTPIPGRAAFMKTMSDQITKVMEAERAI